MLNYNKHSVTSAPTMSSVNEVASNSQNPPYGNFSQGLQYTLAPNNNPNSVPPSYFPFVPPPSPPPPYSPSNLNELPYVNSQYLLQQTPYPPPPPHSPISQQTSNPPSTLHHLQPDQSYLPQFSNFNSQAPYSNPTTQTSYPNLQNPYPNSTSQAYSQPLPSNTFPQTPFSFSQPMSPSYQAQTAIPSYPPHQSPVGFPPQSHNERSCPQETYPLEKGWALQGPASQLSTSGHSEYSPSCPNAEELDDIPDRPPRRRDSSRASSIGFEGDTQHFSNLYPSLSNNSTPKSSISRRGDTESSGTTPLPPNLIVLWESSSVKVYFVQNEGHVVSPDRPVKFTAYKSPPTTDVSSFPIGSLAGKALNSTLLLQLEDTWRLGFAKQRSFTVRGLQGEYGFYDDSTSPARYVVIILPKEITKEERQRLDVLLKASSAMTDEPSTIVDKFESGFESVFDTLTQNVGSVVKKGTPDLHKNTKWLRKTTGNLVRMGGSLVSKGVHLVSDNVMEKEVPKETLGKHKEIFEALKTYRGAIDTNKVTRVLPLTQ